MERGSERRNGPAGEGEILLLLLLLLLDFAADIDLGLVDIAAKDGVVDVDEAGLHAVEVFVKTLADDLVDGGVGDLGSEASAELF